MIPAVIPAPAAAAATIAPATASFPRRVAGLTAPSASARADEVTGGIQVASDADGRVEWS
jgi:hypothetical protein